MSMTIDVANTAVFEHRKSQVRSYCRSIDAIFDTRVSQPHARR